MGGSASTVSSRPSVVIQPKPADNANASSHHAMLGESCRSMANHQSSRHLTAQHLVCEHFEGSVKEDEFIARSHDALHHYGFERGHCIVMLSACRDELTRCFEEAMSDVWGSTFNIASLAGMVTCGMTGFKAAMHHAPQCPDGRERYVMMAFPHIGITADGEVGKVWRRGRHCVSTACGAVCAFVSELADKESGLSVSLNPNDLEQSLLKQTLLSKIPFGRVPTIIEATKLLHDTIREQIESTVESLNIDTKKADYAVITGIQIHGPHNVDFIWPGTMYCMKDGHRQDLSAEFRGTTKHHIVANYQKKNQARRLIAQMEGGNFTIIRKWIERSKDVNLSNDVGISLLHCACKLNHLPTVKLLVENGAKDDIVDNNGLAPSDMTTDPAIIDYLNSVQLPRKEKPLSH